jgi:hypothetical protein
MQAALEEVAQKRFDSETARKYMRSGDDHIIQYPSIYQTINITRKVKSKF